MSAWPHELPPPIFPLDNARIAVIQSAGTKDGKRMDWREARELYEREQMLDGREPSDDHYRSAA